MNTKKLLLILNFTRDKFFGLIRGSGLKIIKYKIYGKKMSYQWMR